MRSAPTRAISPIGRLTQNTDRQPRVSVSTPPSTHPLAPPVAAAAVHQPTARRRCAPGSLSALSRASAAGDSNAAPTP